ncbi:MAG: RNA polymerase sigma factor [Anaerovoracaceae bacterium]
MADDTDKIVEKLYETYREELVRWCRSMTGDLQTAEELVQEAFLRALLHGALLSELGESKQRAWLYRTVKNLYVDRVRRGKWETTVERISEGMEAAKESEEIHRMELEELLESLPEPEGLLLVLRYFQGYNSKQIGEMLNLPAGTVRAKLCEARNHLRRLIREATEI